jgi:thiol-disulfide isomerase/thioredoxin
MNRWSSIAILVLACGAAVGACRSGEESKSDAEADRAPAGVEMVGYDIRRLRPRNEELLVDMFQRTFDTAVADGKMVAVLFSADWCEPCRVLDTELGNEHPVDMIGHVRVIELKEEDWEGVTRMDEFNALRSRWHKTLNSYPVVVLLDDKGEKVEEMKEAITRLEGEGLDPTLPIWFASRREAANEGS